MFHVRNAIIGSFMSRNAQEMVVYFSKKQLYNGIDKSA
jgi:hypothetical protein